MSDLRMTDLKRKKVSIRIGLQLQWNTTTSSITSHEIITARRVLQCCSSRFYSVSVQTVYLMFSLHLTDLV